MREDEARSAGACAATSGGSTACVDDRLAIAASRAPIGSFSGPFEQHLDEEQHDEVEEQRRHHLVDAEAQS